MNFYPAYTCNLCYTAQRIIGIINGKLKVLCAVRVHKYLYMMRPMRIMAEFKLITPHSNSLSLFPFSQMSDAYFIVHLHVYIISHAFAMHIPACVIRIKIQEDIDIDRNTFLVFVCSTGVLFQITSNR